MWRRIAGLGLMSAVVCVTAQLPSAVMATEPMRLTDAQMDGITAGATGVFVSTTAVATGDNAITSTSTYTTVKSNKKVDIARGHGSGFASGDQHDTSCTTGYIADADRTKVHTVHHGRNTEEFSACNCRITVISFTGMKPLPPQARGGSF